MIKILGALYLFYIGFQIFFSKADNLAVSDFNKKQDVQIQFF